MPQIREIEVPVDGGELAAFRLGEAGRGQVVVAIHGITASSRAWLAVARALDGRAALLAPDLRGRGRSSGLPGPFGIAQHVRDVLALLDHFELDRAVLVGHSLGAYVITRLAVEHPERVRAAVLVDGGLTLPVSELDDPDEALARGLGPALSRLQMVFGDRRAYREWWQRHPACAGSDIAEQDLVAYADHDLVGREDEMRSTVVQEAVRADATDLLDAGEAADRMPARAVHLSAPRGLVDDPNPLQPEALVAAWVDAAPDRRRAIRVPDVNHYTITMGAAGARVVADAVAEAAAKN